MSKDKDKGIRYFLVSYCWERGGRISFNSVTVAKEGDWPLCETTHIEMTKLLRARIEAELGTIENLCVLGWSEFEKLDNKLREEEEDAELRWMPRKSEPLVDCPECGASVDKYLGYQYRYCPMCGVRLCIPEG